jgi:hypothetical protein
MESLLRQKLLLLPQPRLPWNNFRDRHFSDTFCTQCDVLLAPVEPCSLARLVKPLYQKGSYAIKSFDN